ncbi:MAG: CHAT domain-containing protein [Lewinella sp.]|nr:CHAT domain-containing protein [Lewinella sp.]
MIDQIRTLIGESNLDEALELLDQHYASSEVTMFKGRYNRLRAEGRQGTVSHDSYNLEYNRITEAILEYLDRAARGRVRPSTATPPRKPEDRATGFMKNYQREAKQVIEVPMVVNRPPFSSFEELPDERIKLLFLAATPGNQRPLNTGLESRFKDLIHQFDRNRRIDFREEHGLSSEGFQHILFTEDPHIVHYGGHGEKEGIVLQDEALSGEVLAEIIANSTQIQVVVLNACYSKEIARVLATRVPYVVGTQGPISDDAAIAFARGFYVGIAAGKDIERSFKNGLTNIKRENLKDADIPILFKGTLPASLPE